MDDTEPSLNESVRYQIIDNIDVLGFFHIQITYSIGIARSKV